MIAYQPLSEFKNKLPKQVLDINEHCRILKINTRIIYDKFGQVYSPALKENVIFNGRGFHHLLNNSDGTPRDVREIIYKLTLIPLVVSVIKKAVTVDQEREIVIRESRKKYAKVRKAKAYSLVALVGKKSPVKIRVILIKI